MNGKKHLHIRYLAFNMQIKFAREVSWHVILKKFQLLLACVC